MFRVRDVVLTPAPGWTEEEGSPRQRGEDDLDDSPEAEAAEIEVRFIGSSVSTEVVNGEAFQVVDAEAEIVRADEAEPETADTEEIDKSSEESGEITERIPQGGRYAVESTDYSETHRTEENMLEEHWVTLIT